MGGLLFADDVCALAPSRKRLQAALRKIEGWAAQWKMAVGVRKCGIMVFFGEQRKLEEQAWQISGEDLPVVASYKYLGVTLVGSLDLGTVVDGERVRCAEKAFHLMAPFLGSATVRWQRGCWCLRRQCCRSCLMGRNSWGNTTGGSTSAYAALHGALSETNCFSGAKCGWPYALQGVWGGSHCSICGRTALSGVPEVSLPEDLDLGVDRPSS